MTRKMPPLGGSSREAAAYIADMASGLAMIARRNGFAMISFLLDMVRLEADNIAKSGQEPDES